MWTKIRIVFLGSTVFGLRCLERLIGLSDCEVVGILTTPDVFTISYRPEGVRNVMYADFHPLAACEKIPIVVLRGPMTDPNVYSTIESWKPDLIVVAGWYHLVPKEIRSIAPAVGLHASLLPDYSGGAPLVWAIINGEDRTGITLFMLDDGVDSGGIIGQRDLPIYLNDTIATLYRRVEREGLALLEEHIPRISWNEAVTTVQDNSKRRVMPQRKPQDGLIDWNWSAWRLYNFIRAQSEPYPGVFTFLAGEKLTIWEAKLFDHHPRGVEKEALAAGEVIAIISEGPLQGVLVATRDGDHPLLITRVGFGEDHTLSGLEFSARQRMACRKVFLGT